jgi:hypothetical protein
MKALVLGGFAHMDTETKQQYWTEVTVPSILVLSLYVTLEFDLCVATILPVEI